MELKEYLNTEKLDAHVRNGYVDRKRSKNADLWVYNYTLKTTSEWLWDDVTIKCRGLIVDAFDEIVARPREKFFNLNSEKFPETMLENLPFDKRWEVTDKLDGVCGTVYKYQGEVGVATRGSFHSIPGEWANKHYNQYFHGAEWPKDHTPVVEIIWKGFPIVCDYPYDDLVLTGLVHNETGAELPWDDLSGYANHNGMRVVERINSKELVSLTTANEPNKEGFVVTFFLGDDCTPLKVKIKMESYKELSYLMKTTSVTGLWEMMRKGEDMSFMYGEKMPQHYRAWVLKETAKIRQNFKYQKHKIEAIVDDLPEHLRKGKVLKFAQRKELAETFHKFPADLRGLLFASYDDSEQLSNIIYKQIRPENNRSPEMREE